MESARQLLGLLIRVRISDGRVVEGELQCLDKDLNLVLGSAIEYHGMMTHTAKILFPCFFNVFYIS